MSSETEPPQSKPEVSLLARVGVNPVAFLVTIVILLVFMPTFVLLLGGMMPSIVAFVLDDTARKSKCKAISYLNLSGCIIVGMDLWTGGNTISDALNIFLVPINLVIMYGMAMFGWILVRSMDPFIISYLRLSYQSQQKSLRKRRKALLKEWGEHVTVISKNEGFVFDNNVYLDDDEVTVDPDEKIDNMVEDEIEKKKPIENQPSPS